jgi:Leucine-rich repeat (LRR) protein
MRDEKLRSWKRFSIRTMFLLVSLIAATLGASAYLIDDFRQQARSLAVVQRLNGEAEFIPAHGPAWKRWLVTTMLGDDAFAEVAIVNLSGKKVDDATLEQLSGLRHLRELNLDNTQITDAGTHVLRSFAKLRLLSLRFTEISDESTETIAGLEGLIWLYLTHTQVSDASIDNLSKLKHLDELYVRWTNITDAGSEQLKKSLPGCAVFHHWLQN